MLADGGEPGGGRARDVARVAAWQLAVWQPLPPPCRRVGHAVVDQHEAVAVVGDVDRGHVAVGQRGPAPRVVDVAGDGGASCAGAREELRGVEVVEVEEDAGQGEREEVLTQQAAVIDHRAPRPADAAARGKAARRESPEDLRDHVVR